MTAKEAYLVLITKYPGIKVGKCYEFNSLFVFQLMPDMLRLSKTHSRMLDGSLSVNKKTRVVRDFKPFHITVDEYKAGVEVPKTSYFGWR